ncbi:DUF1045 domain-containing protein [Roseobacter sinensis]|uniref:DUF1045 domain-containing protein n=1 Tax=Roseobacter sinensis TaxID=2931391 RepID=A0ABT3BCA2_9RHOB|nr:DUF1045 domain-containing protein [Roseobacter sp. WL0113]MCV3270758.1 DUF1045 domain-containing protein [Roseobacter sp. WL0113]
MGHTRYGVYFTPRPGAFAEAGATWLGWDIAAGIAAGHPDDSVTRRPRKYGFHGTIKPPFRLADGRSRADLMDAMERLSTRLAPVALDGLTLSQIGSFIALTPTGDVRDLAQLAATVVKELDCFRAPPTDAELARRRQSRLTPVQEENLARWGYPYVMEAFRFHMTLTGPMPREMVGKVLADANAHFDDVPPRPFVVDSLTLVGERDGEMFEELHRYSLSGK